jgi:hypothetical protein
MIIVVALLLSGIGDDAIAKARAKYDSVEYDKAIAILDKAAAQDMPPGEKARVLAFKALVHAQMADENAWKKDLDDALTLDACVAMPDAPAPAALRAALQAQRDARTTPAHLTTTPPPAAPPPTPSSSSNAPVWIGTGLASAGAVALIAGGVFGAIGFASHGAAASAKFQSDVLANDDSARTDFVVANVLFAAGGALIVTGGVSAAIGFAVE